MTGQLTMDGPDDLRLLTAVGAVDRRCVGGAVIYLESTDSTNLQARRLAEGGAPEGTLVIADEQTAGRGRMGRSWASPPGVNLYLSLVLRPPIAAHQAPQVTLLSSLAVAEAVESCFGLAAEVKWPNDVLVGGRKIAGLLGEIAASMAGVDFIILGMGINVNMDCRQLPPRPLYPATSIAIEKGEKVARLPLAEQVLARLDFHYGVFLKEGFAPVRRLWQERCAMLGRRIEVDNGGDIIRGEAFAIDEGGALLLRLPTGRVERLLSGDILSVAPLSERCSRIGRTDAG